MSCTSNLGLIDTGSVSSDDLSETASSTFSLIRVFRGGLDFLSRRRQRYEMIVDMFAAPKNTRMSLLSLFGA
jgi:hypothetical protein